MKIRDFKKHFNYISQWFWLIPEEIQWKYKDFLRENGKKTKRRLRWISVMLRNPALTDGFN